MRLKAATLILVLAVMPAGLCGQSSKPSVTIKVDAAHPGAEISPQMFGIFFEDINFGADGGLYPELVKNRSFEFNEPLAGWHEVMGFSSKGLDRPKGELDIRTDDPLNQHNPHYLRVRAVEPGYALFNSGFRGMGIQEGAEYRFSAYVRTHGPKSLRAVVLDEKHKPIATGNLDGFDGHWKKYETIIRATGSAEKAQLNLSLDEAGSVDIDMVSLFPVDTWKHRPNGLRKDLVQFLYDMHPGFLRFPGGCIVEGRRLATRYQWKKTVGDLAERQTLINRWNDEFDTRPAPDYFQSFGLGFYEYFQLAEDIGARPLPILNCGMACQFNSSETAALDELHEYIQDALDLIDFANGPVTTPWGKLRAQMGHPAPFHLTMIGVGNEQWGDRYLERYKVFAAALKAKHPEIKLVVSAGPFPTGEPFDSMWTNWRKLNADIVDEHYYMSPEWFLSNTGRYDHYDRSGPKVFAGEYAAQSVRINQSSQPQQLEDRHLRSRVYDRARAQWRCCADGFLCAPAGQRQRLAVDSRRDLVRQSPVLWHSRLLRPESLRKQHGHPCRALNTASQRGPVHERRGRRPIPRIDSQGSQLRVQRENRHDPTRRTPGIRHRQSHHALKRGP